MAHFAKIGKNNVVEDLIFLDNSDVENKDFPDSEKIGQNYIASLGIEGKWLQTSYNNNFRGSYAYVGYKYDSKNDVFTAPSAPPTWIKNDYGMYVPPIPYPDDPNTRYLWDEDAQQWVAE